MRYKKYKLNPDMSVSSDGPYDPGVPCPWTMLACTRVWGHDIKLQFSPYDLNWLRTHSKADVLLFAVDEDYETVRSLSTYAEALKVFNETVEEIDKKYKALAAKPIEIIMAPKLVFLTVPCLVST